MGLFKSIKKGFKKVVGGVKKQVSKVAKIVKKSVKGVAKVVRETGRGIKKLTKNKYVRMGLMIAAAVCLPVFVPAIAALPAVAAGAVTGAITGGAGALLSGGDFKDVLKGAAFGSATGAAFAKIGEAIKTARTSKEAIEAAASGDVFGGELAASGEKIAIGADAAPTVDISGDITTATDIASTATDAAPTVGISGDITTPTLEELRAVSFEPPDFQFDPTEVSKFSIDPNFNPTDSFSPTGKWITTTTNVPSETFVYPDGIMKQGAPAHSVTINKPGIDASQLKIPTSVEESLKWSQNYAKYGSIDPTLGQKISTTFRQTGDRLKEAFSPDNVLDKSLEVGETLLINAAQTAIANRMADDQYVGDPAYAQQEYANQLQEVQRVYRQADINLTDAYSHIGHLPFC